MNKSNKDKLFEFLEEFKVKKGEVNTHTSLNPNASYNITGNARRDRFMALYKAALDDGEELHFTEKHKSQGPILVDIDIKYTSTDSNDRRYNDDHIMYIIEKYNRLLNHYLDISDEQLQVFVFEKQTPTIAREENSNDEIKYSLKDGFHLMYPYICTEPEIQYLIRKEVIDMATNDKLFSDINAENSLDDIFDNRVIKDNNWFLYGSSKPDRDPYLVTKAFYVLEPVDINQSYDPDTFPDLFSIRQYNNEEIINFKNNYTKEIITTKCKDLGLIKVDKPIIFKQNYNKNNPDEVRIARKLVRILSPKRAVDYDQWIQVGWCLHNINESLLDEWIEFSKKAKNKFKAGECEKLWEKFKDDGYSIASLYKWAKDDNLEKYTEIKLEEIHDKIQNGVTGTAWDTAKVVYEQYKHTFVCTSVKNKKWYEFKGHKWEPVDEAYSLNHKLSEEVVNMYTSMSSWYGNLAKENKFGDKDNLLQKANSASNITLKLRQTKFKRDVLSECMTLFYNPTFVEKLDEQRSLIGFNNGVYDLENNIFRSGRPEDMISMTTGIDYVPYDPNDPITQEVEKFIRDIQPEDDMRSYVLDLLASCLQGHVPDEKFHIWTGTGGNGKSLLIMLFMKALGEYCATLPSSLITGKRSASNAASPEMARTKGKRFCILQEPEEKDQINLGLMKELTGGDKIMARGLFQDPIEFYPQFKLILTCNKLPHIASNDGGTWRRIRLVPFDMKFVENPKEPNERKIDKTIKSKLDMWKTAFMSILIKRFQNYKLNGLIEPPKVQVTTNKYQADSDIFMEFINQRIELTKDPKDSLKIGNIYEEFKIWFKNEQGGKKIPTRPEVKSYFEEKFKKMPPSGWKGMRILEEIDEDEQQEEKISIDDLKPSKKSKMNALDM